MSATLYLDEWLVWVRFARNAPPRRTAAYPPIAAVPSECRRRKSRAKSGGAGHLAGASGLPSIADLVELRTTAIGQFFVGRGLGSEIAAIFRWRRPIDEASAPPEPPTAG